MRVLMAVAFGTSFVIMFLGVLLMMHIDLFTGILVFGIGGIYFYKYLPTTENLNQK
jgi:hypothetical protein|tara:strand:+ start:1708 stop:1875 length:168 start_codon:yes stop_codon:yes gene_type:complete